MTPQIATGRSGQPIDINSVIAGMVDRGAWIYYDELVTAAGTQLQAQYQFFSVPVGKTDPITGLPKTLINTNMKVANQFPPPRCLVLMQMGFYFRNMSLTDMQIILNNYYMEFFIDDKKFFEGTLEMYPSGIGLSGSSTISGDSNFVDGLPSDVYTRKWGRYSKYVAPLQLFTAQLTCGYQTPPTITAANVGGKGLNLYWMLNGLTDRAVQ